MQIKSNKTTNSLKGRKSYPRDGQTLSDRVPHKQNWRNRNQWIDKHISQNCNIELIKRSRHEIRSRLSGYQIMNTAFFFMKCFVLKLCLDFALVSFRSLSPSLVF